MVQNTMAESSSEDALQKLSQYVHRMREAEQQRMDSDVTSSELREFETQLDNTIQLLQQQVTARRRELDEVGDLQHEP